jgi:hypothetical protein
MYALFNNDKKFIGYSPELPENLKILKKEIPKEFSNLEIWHWEGDYDTGKMTQTCPDYPIKEIELEKELFKYIDRRYPLNIQLLNIIKQLKKITKSNDLLQDDDFTDMADCILNAIDKHNNRVKFYQKHAKFEPNRDKFESLFRS